MAVLTGMSAYPGLIASTLFDMFGFFFTIPQLALWLLFVGIRACRELAQQRPMRSAYAIQAVLVTVFAFGLIATGIPVRAGFAVSRPALEQLRKASADADAKAASTGWFGIYRVDRYATDPRGGFFVRTCTGSDMIDTLSFGFVYRPNPVGTPFGRASYFLSPVSGEWQAFSVSNDF